MASLFPPPSPGLPPFRTLLVQGPFHPSAPVHLMLSQNAQNQKGKALMITPSRQTLAAALVECGDEWLKIHGGHGQTCSASSRVDILLVLYRISVSKVIPTQDIATRQPKPTWLSFWRCCMSTKDRSTTRRRHFPLCLRFLSFMRYRPSALLVQMSRRASLNSRLALFFQMPCS